MAIACTVRSTVFTTSNTQSTYTGTTSYTPAANSLLLCFVCTAYSSSPSDPTSVTGHGLSYTKLTLGTSTLSTTHKLSAWVAKAGGSPSSVAPVANVTSTNGTGGVLIEVEVTGANVDDTDLAAIINSTYSNSGTSATPNVTLNSPGSSDNRAILFVVQASNNAPTAGGNFSVPASGSGNFNTPATGAAVLTRDSVFDTAGAATTQNVAWRIIGLEIKASQLAVVRGLNDSRPYAVTRTGGGVAPPATPGLKGERGRPGPALRALMRHVDTQRFESPGVASAAATVTGSPWHYYAQMSRQAH